jgi:hypothetical protein
MGGFTMLQSIAHKLIPVLVLEAVPVVVDAVPPVPLTCLAQENALAARAKAATERAKSNRFIKPRAEILLCERSRQSALVPCSLQRNRYNPCKVLFGDWLPFDRGDSA